MAWVRADGVWKRFLLHKDRADSVGQLLVRMIPGRSRRPRSEPFWALQDVSLEMAPGRSLGIVGSNGSGKSTMLKLLTRTMVPTRGTISVHGRIAALIELGAGFHPDFTGRENIVLNASILGIRRREIERRMDDIIDFSEIRPFVDTPVKYYSSGMQARLAFSVAIHVDADILVVDEVLAVGDDVFQQKCMQRIFELKRSGVSILLVSHDLTSIDRLTDQAVWIEKGIVRAAGRPGAVIRAYRSRQVEASTSSRENPNESHDAPIGAEARIKVRGRPVERITTGDTVDVVLHMDNRTPLMIVGYMVLVIRRPDGLLLAEVSGLHDDAFAALPPGKSEIAVSLKGVHLAAGSYEIDATFETRTGEQVAVWASLCRFSVSVPTGSGGVLMVPHEWRLGDLEVSPDGASPHPPSTTQSRNVP